MRPAKAAVLSLALCAASGAFAGVWFKPVEGPPDALEISDVSSGTGYSPVWGGIDYPHALFAVPDRGFFENKSKEYRWNPCPGGGLVDVIHQSAYRVWTDCGGYILLAYDDSASPAGAGLPSGASVTALANGLVGTSSAGVFLFGASLTPANEGLPPRAAIRTLRWVPGRSSWVAALVGGGVYEAAPVDRGAVEASGTLAPIPNVSAPSVWRDVSAGLPPNAAVTAVGGTSNLFAAVEGSGIWRLGSSGVWRHDSAGATVSVSSISSSFAAAGAAGVLRRSGGAWVPEASGLPAGAEARVLGSAPGRGPFGTPYRTLFLGTRRHGAYAATLGTSVRTLPAVVNTVGATGQPFRTELTIGTVDGADEGNVRTHVFGLPQGWIAASVGPGEFRTADAAAWLRTLGWSFPSEPAALSLSLAWAYPRVLLPENLYMLARVFTAAPGGGTYGVMVEAPTDEDAAEEIGTVYGLRTIPGVDRSNLAVVHVPSRGADPITLSVRIFSAEGAPAPRILTASLAPGEFHQWNDVLGLAGLQPGSSGYARIVRTEGVGAWTGYGVVNDAATSDGSLLPLYRPAVAGSLSRLLVPVVLDVAGAAGAHYTTELTLANDSASPSRVDFTYHPAPGYGPAVVHPPVTISLEAGHQTTIPDILAFLRSRGRAIPTAGVGPQAGSLEVSFRDLAGSTAGRAVAFARTTTPNPDAGVGGRFGVSYPAVAWGGGAHERALVPALTQDGDSRSNVAVVNVGGGSESDLTLRLRAGQASRVVTLRPGEWFQWNQPLLETGWSGPFRVEVTRVAGDDAFYAYGVVNDQVTSDGSFIPMIVRDPD